MAQYAPGERVNSSEFAGFSVLGEDVLNPPLVKDLMRQMQLEREALKLQSEKMAARLRDLGIDPDTL